MRNAFIFHGACGHPQENWFPWLKSELEKSGCRVFVPKFPTPEGQTLDNWMAVLEKYRAHLTPDSILIGHSLGVPFLLNVLEKCPCRAAFLVAGFTGIAGNKFDPGMKTFAQREFSWEKIRKNCKRFYVFNSDNDPYIRLEKGKELALDLGTHLILVKGAGHFNESAGYAKFPILLELIKKEA